MSKVIFKALCDVRGNSYTFDCNKEVTHLVKNTRENTKVGEVTVEQLQIKLNSIVEKIAEMGKEYAKGNIAISETKFKADKNAYLSDLDYYTKKLKELLGYPNYKYLVKTQLHSGNIQFIRADLDVLQVTNPNLYVLSVQKHSINGAIIMQMLLENLGYVIGSGVQNLVVALKKANFSRTVIECVESDDLLNLMSALLLIFKDLIGDAENELKELYHILTYSLVSNLILGAKSEVCKALDLGSLTLEDYNDSKYRINYYTTDNYSTLPNAIEARLKLSIKLTDESVLSMLYRFRSIEDFGKDLKESETDVYIPILITKAIDLK